MLVQGATRHDQNVTRSAGPHVEVVFGSQLGADTHL